MRVVVIILLVLVSVAPALAGPNAAPRHGIEVDLQTYPQSSPKETLSSLLAAIENKRVDYLLAHLADPEWVDQRLKDTGGKLNELRQETTARLMEDPKAAKHLRRLLEEGEWETDTAAASVHLKEGADHWVFLRKRDGRWFLENRWKPDLDRKN
jgi:hypothetical protein